MLLRFLRSHAGQRLIEQQQLGPGRQRQGDVELALRAVRQGASGPVENIVEADRPRQGERAVVQCRFRRAPAQAAEAGTGLRLHGQQQIVEHRVLAEHAGDLEAARQAVPHAPVRRQGGQFDAVQRQAASVQRQQAGDQIDQRGLARAIRTDQRMDFARLDREVDVVHGDQPAKMLEQILGDEQAHAGVPGVLDQRRQPLGGQEHDQDQQQAQRPAPVLGIQLQRLRQRQPDRSAQRRAPAPAQAADHHHHQQRGRFGPVHQRRADEPVMAGEQRAGQPGHRAGGDKRGELDPLHRIAERFHAGFIVADAPQRVAETRDSDAVEEGEQQRGEGEHHPVERALLRVVESHPQVQRRIESVTVVAAADPQRDPQVVQHLARRRG